MHLLRSKFMTMVTCYFITINHQRINNQRHSQANLSRNPRKGHSLLLIILGIFNNNSSSSSRNSNHRVLVYSLTNHTAVCSFHLESCNLSEFIPQVQSGQPNVHVNELRNQIKPMTTVCILTSFWDITYPLIRPLPLHQICLANHLLSFRPQLQILRYLRPHLSRFILHTSTRSAFHTLA
jgi:hypothetical protein